MNGPVLISLIAVMGILGVVYAATDHNSPLPRISFAIAGAIGILALDLPWLVTLLLFLAASAGWIAMRSFNRWALGSAPWDDGPQPSKPGSGEDWRSRYGGDAASGNWRRQRRAGEESGYRARSGAGDRPGSPAMDRDGALAALGLDTKASDSDIKRAHRRLMMTHHPDRGGSTAMAARLNRAREYLLGE